MNQVIVKKKHSQHLLHSNKIKESKNILLITSPGNHERSYISQFSEQIKPSDVFLVERYPDYELINQVLNLYQNTKHDLVISLGGGSVLDLAKIYCMASNANHKISSVHELNQIYSSKIFNIAIPTTAGTGAESTCFSTIWNKETKNKESFENILMLPEVVYLVPSFINSLPDHILIPTMLDCISHCLDSLWSKNKTNESLSLCKKSLSLLIESFELNLDGTYSVISRNKLLEASNLAGQAINITRTSLSHAISYPLTNKFNFPHGLACAFTLNSINNYFEKEIFIEALEVEVKAILNIVNNFGLQEIYKSYFTDFNLEQIINEVFMNSRLDNFIVTPTKGDIESIIKSSLKKFI